MFSKVAAAVLPFWASIGFYSADVRLAAFKKFLVLWAMSLAPLFLAAALQKIPGAEGLFAAFLKKFGASFFERHQFIYAVSFITPIFYLMWERYQGARDYVLSEKRSKSEVKLTPPGFGVIVLWSVLFYLVTTAAYAIAATRSDSGAALTILEAGSHYSTIVVYIFGLLCWYFMILDGSSSPTTQYFKVVKQQEEQSQQDAKAFSKRISSREDEA